jgi:pimeloyl-ACP methyl ester carboxylesterase
MDCISALRWIADNIAEHGGSPDRLFVGGHSAGGQIAALMALQKDWLVQSGVAVDAIKGCFCLATTFNRRMIRPDIAPNDVQPGSALGDLMSDALAATGCRVQSLVLPECDHFSVHLNTQYGVDPWVRQVRKLMADTPSDAV